MRWGEGGPKETCGDKFPPPTQTHTVRHSRLHRAPRGRRRSRFKSPPKPLHPCAEREFRDAGRSSPGGTCPISAFPFLVKLAHPQNALDPNFAAPGTQRAPYRRGRRVHSVAPALTCPERHGSASLPPATLPSCALLAPASHLLVDPARAG